MSGYFSARRGRDARERTHVVEIQGKKAVIVGGASGMAKATAELLRQKGAEIAILDLPTSAGAEVAKALGGHVPRGRRARRRSRSRPRWPTPSPRSAACTSRSTPPVAVTAKRTLTKEGPHPARRLPPHDRAEPHRHVQPQPAAGLPHVEQRARGRRARRHHRHRVHRRLRGPDRAGGLHGGQGRHRGHDADHGPRSRQPGHPGPDHRAQPVQHRPDRGHPGRVRRRPHEGRRLPQAHGPPRGVRQARRGDRREPRC